MAAQKQAQSVSAAEERAQRSVFVGNIPYEASEEQLKEVFQQAGPVISFRLVYDRETGKPKGYGFCEYQDVETAQSAMRNLNNHDYNGRPLRVGVAAGEQNKDENKSMQQALGGPLVESPFGDPVEPTEAPEAISKAVASLPPEQMFELMKQMKLCIQNNPNEARNMLLQNPQLAYALLQGQIVMKIVDPQVALAMLHRQTEQIPPLLPSASQSQAPPTSTQQQQPMDVDHRLGPGGQAGPGGPGRPGLAPQQAGLGPGMPPVSSMGTGPPSSMAPNTSMANTRMTAPQQDFGPGSHGIGGGPGPRGPPNILDMNTRPGMMDNQTGRDNRQGGMMDNRQGGMMDNRPGMMDNRQGMMDQRTGMMDNRQGPMDSRLGPSGGMDNRGGMMGDRGPGPMDRGMEGQPPRGFIGDPRAQPGMGRLPGAGGGPMGGPGTRPDMGGYGGGPRPGGDMGPRGGPGSGPRHEFRDPRQGAGDPRQRGPPGPGPSMAGGPPRSQAGGLGALGIPGLASAAAAGAGGSSNSQDQEKAALIMQVLQLSDEQIALLPPDQRSSILILKEQISRTK